MDVALPVSPARLRTRLAAVALAVAAMAAVPAPGAVWDRPAGAQETIVIDDPRLDPSLAGVQVVGDGYQKSLAAYGAPPRPASPTPRTASPGHRGGRRPQTGERDRLNAEIDQARPTGATAGAAGARGTPGSLRAVAVATYVQGRDTTADALLGGAEEAATAGPPGRDGERRDRASHPSRSARRRRRHRRHRPHHRGRHRRRSPTSRRAPPRPRPSATTPRPRSTPLRTSTAGARRTPRRLAPRRRRGRQRPPARRPRRLRQGRRRGWRFERPECGLRWTGLAGIGKVESGHGTYGGSRLSATGDTSQPIIGIPLDGSAGTAAIGDTDGGELDGDPTTDRAVGPMQFIPGSWRSLGRDGNGDGRADPSNIYDAALAAAGLLCRAVGIRPRHRRRALPGRARPTTTRRATRASWCAPRTPMRRQESQLIPPPPPTTTTTVEAPAPVAPGPPRRLRRRRGPGGAAVPASPAEP